MIRFHVATGDQLVNTPWEEEPVLYSQGQTHTAVVRMNELRKQYGNEALISVERTTVIPEPDRKQVRFRIVNKDETRYSVPFPISERETQLAEMWEKFPKATITAEVIHGNQ